MDLSERERRRGKGSNFLPLFFGLFWYVGFEGLICPACGNGDRKEGRFMEKTMGTYEHVHVGFVEPISGST